MKRLLIIILTATLLLAYALPAQQVFAAERGQTAAGQAGLANQAGLADLTDQANLEGSEGNPPDGFEVAYEYTGEVPPEALPAPEGEEGVAPGELMVVADNPPEPPGFVFHGWETEDVSVIDGGFTMPEGDVVFTGSWSQIEYTVIYAPGAQGTWNVASQTYSGLHYGDETPKFTGSLKRDHRDGYTFSRWSPRIEDTVSHNIIYTAVWTAVIADTPSEVAPDASPEAIPDALSGSLSYALPEDIYDAPLEDTPETLPTDSPDSPVAFSDIPTIEIEPEEVPLDASLVEIIPGPPPLASIRASWPPLSTFTAWAPLNLILTIATGLIMAQLLLADYRMRKSGPNSCRKAKNLLDPGRLIAAATAIAALLFILTQDMALPMAPADKWTVWHAAITALALVLATLGRKTQVKKYPLTGRS